MTIPDSASPSVGATAHALWYVAPQRAEIRVAPLPARGPDAVRVETEWSAVSRGTERLVFNGLADPQHGLRMRAPLQEGDFPFPVKYGYCSVGRVTDGPADLAGRMVFCLAPHQDVFNAPVAAVIPLPPDLPPRRATLAANMETALNALWDSGAGAGDRVVVVGAGLVGLLVAALAAQLPGARVTAIDPDGSRGAVAEALGFAFAPDASRLRDADVVIHASATAAGLEAAIACCGTEARLVELSWYGDAKVSVGLGGAFHARRLSIVSSQVGAIPPARRPRWDFRRRLATALELLRDDRLDALITQDVAFADLPRELGRILAPGAPGIVTVIRYDGAGIGG